MEVRSEWWRGAVFYHVYPRSFQDSNGDGVGDLVGVTNRLDYISELGADAIWLSPFYPSPQRDFGYDVSDFLGVGVEYGSLRDFDNLAEAAAARGMRVIVDLVANHTSDQHPWFIEAGSSANSDRRHWYWFDDARLDGSLPNNWPSFFSESGSAWTPHLSGGFYLHSFTKFQPDLNWCNPAVRQSILDVMRFWLSRGAAGFRVDALPLLGKDPLLRDNAESWTAWGTYNIDWPTVHEYVREMRVLVDDASAVLIGEVNILSLARLAEYVRHDELHLVHSFFVPQLPFEARAFADLIVALESAFAGTWPSWYLGNHDDSRVVTRYGSDGRGLQRARLLGLLLLTLRGTPFIYQGEELGLEDVEQDASAHGRDIAGRDPQRAPIPWTSTKVGGPGAGFTSGIPWRTISPRADDLNVDAQRSDVGSHLNFYRDVLQYRRRSHALKFGGLSECRGEDDVLRFRRYHGSEDLLVALNFSLEPHVITLPEGEWWIALGTKAQVRQRATERLELPGLGGLVLERSE